MAIASQCTEATFRLTGEDGAENIKEVDIFTYLSRPLDWSGDNWPEILRNIRKAGNVWGRLEKLLQREGEDPFVSTNFYHAVVQPVLLFGAETWVLLAAMSKKLEGVHVNLLH